jgi:hypothetical protein
MQAHKHDKQLEVKLLQLFRARKVTTLVDLGCGLGDYCRFFTDSGIECACYDGNLDTRNLTGGLCDTRDLSVPLRLGRTFDCVLSLEVGEHIPAAYEAVFFDNLVRHAAKIIVLSWAVPRQGGIGHVNEQPNEYVIARLAEHGFLINTAAAQELRDSATLWWFKNTLMVFERETAVN